jgi:hypothetical protein
MIINKDQSNPHDIKLAFDGADASAKSFAGPITMTTFGREQYMWKSDGPNSHPDPNQSPVTKTLPPGTGSVNLPKASVTILRAKLAS